MWSLYLPPMSHMQLKTPIILTKIVKKKIKPVHHWIPRLSRWMKAIDWRKTWCWTRDLIILWTKIWGSCKAMMEGETWLASSCRSLKMERYLSNLPTADDITRHFKWRSQLIIIIIKFLFQLLECSFSHKAKNKYCLLQRTAKRGQTHLPWNHAFINPEKRWSHK